MEKERLLENQLDEGSVEGGDEQLYEHFRFVADRGQSQIRVDKFVTDRLEKSSRNRVQMAISAGFVLVNGVTVKANYKVKPLDVVTIEMPYERERFEVIPEEIPLDIIYEDSDLLVVNKAAGMVVHPGHGHFSGTLINALAHYLNLEQEREPKDARMGILVHRIDKNTSGLLLVAKNEQSQLHLSKQFFNHTIDRKYLALVWGNLKEESGTIVANIGRDPGDRLKFKVFPDGSAGKEAITHYRVVERFGYTTLVECILETGRTHQIRVHMEWLGHPLFNDERYGGDKIRKGTIYKRYKQFVDNSFQLFPRHALHAKTLAFTHPTTGERVELTNELPQEMEELINRWKNFSKES